VAIGGVAVERPMTTKRGALSGSASPLPIDVQLMSMRLAWNIRQAGGTRLPQITAAIAG
jgi:hypothetical protein